MKQASHNQGRLFYGTIFASFFSFDLFFIYGTFGRVRRDEEELDPVLEVFGSKDLFCFQIFLSPIFIFKT